MIKIYNRMYKLDANPLSSTTNNAISSDDVTMVTYNMIHKSIVDVPSNAVNMKATL